MEEETGRGVVFGFHPDVAKEAVDDAGHADELRAAEFPLGKVGKDRDDENQSEEFSAALTAFNHAAEVEEPPHVKNQVHYSPLVEDGTAVQQHRRKQPPDFASRDFTEAGGVLTDQEG